MIVNGQALVDEHPIHPMWIEKKRYLGVSYGLAEAGYDIRLKEDVVFRPWRRFVLASAVEKFQMPDDLVGVVHDKSTWARKGVSVLNTVIEPGWEGYLTMELVFHGSFTWDWNPNSIPWGPHFKLPAGTGIAQILFSRTTLKARYSGKYQNQKEGPQEAIFE